MENIRSFLSRLDEETEVIQEAEESKNLAREDALALIAAFVKDIKKKFSKKEDQLAILSSASKTLTFYINEIESDEADTSTSMTAVSAEFDPVDVENETDIDTDTVDESDVEV